MQKIHGSDWTKILRVPLLVALVLVLLAVSAIGAAADSGSASYSYFIGTGGSVPPTGPDVTMAADGSTVTTVGQGTLSIHSKSVTGSGTFTIMDSSGNVTATGTWTATSLQSFVSYGNGTPQGFPPNTFGGEAVIQVHLSTGQDAVLKVMCLLGNPPSGKEEGIRLAVQGGPNFNEPVSGETVFTQP